MSGRRRAPRALVSQVVLLLVLSLVSQAGCAHRARGSDPVDVVRQPPSGRLPAELAAALDRVVAAQTGRYRLLVEVDTVAAGGLAAMVTGAFDRPSGRLSCTIHHEALMQAYAQLGAEPPGTLMADRDVVVDGATAYLRGPELAESLGTTGWVSSTGADGDTLVASLVERDAVTDPSTVAELLRGVSGPLRPDGDEMDHDVHTRRFTGSVHLDDIVDRVAPPRRPLVHHQLDAVHDLVGSLLAGDGADVEVPVVVWLADDGSLRRARFTFPTDPEATGVEAARVTLGLYDYDRAVEITVPPASEAQPIEELTGESTP